MFSFFFGLVVTGFTIIVMERYVSPQVNTKTIFHRISILNAMPTVIFYVTSYMVTYRPVFSALSTLIVFAGIIVINNAKYKVLKEPLVYSDFSLLKQAIRYPALYIKYIGVWRVVTLCVVGLSVIVASIMLETPVIERLSMVEYSPTIIYLGLVVGLIYSITRGPFMKPFANLVRRFGPTADIRSDLDKLSLVVTLIFYFLLAYEGAFTQPKQKKSQEGGNRDQRDATDAIVQYGLGQGRHDVVVVQSESFFDVRRLDDSIPKDILDSYDRFAAASVYRGQLTVPAWGANTMRSEFAFLSGLPNEALGYHRFNPYLGLCKEPVWSIAHHFRSFGYRTVCIHPFHAEFFDRKTAFPNLGFDLFLDLNDFDGAETFGPYVSDMALADKIVETLGEHDGPQFIFAITMENHGKWESDRLDAFSEPIEPVLESKEFGIYMRHLKSTNLLVERVGSALEEQDEDSVFCLFGDHQPSFPDLFKQLDFTDTETDYFVWKKNGKYTRNLDTSVDVLHRLVMDAALHTLNHLPDEKSDEPA